ncbi:MAG: flagellar biosynthesis protein FliQ [Bdellovibrionota bacterium]
MNLDSFLELSRYGVETSMMVSAPVLIMGLVAGAAVSMLQAATQINDAALAFIPKMAAVVAALVIFGPWMISRLVSFAIYSINQIPNVAQ